MAKSSLEKAIEKQRKEAEKSARQAQLRERANAIVSGAEIVSGFRIMDREAENMLSAILEQYDGNENNHVNFVLDNLPRYLQDSFSLQCEKLQMYGMLLQCLLCQKVERNILRIKKKRIIDWKNKQKRKKK